MSLKLYCHFKFMVKPLRMLRFVHLINFSRGIEHPCVAGSVLLKSWHQYFEQLVNSRLVLNKEVEY